MPPWLKVPVHLKRRGAPPPTPRPAVDAKADNPRALNNNDRDILFCGRHPCPGCLRHLRQLLRDLAPGPGVKRPHQLLAPVDHESSPGSFGEDCEVLHPAKAGRPLRCLPLRPGEPLHGARRLRKSRGRAHRGRQGRNKAGFQAGGGNRPGGTECPGGSTDQRQPTRHRLPEAGRRT